jgi:DNA-binding NtrC family response regulator
MRPKREISSIHDALIVIVVLMCCSTAGMRFMKRVLVVDDDPGILALVATWLETAGYGVETAGNFASAKLHVSRPKEVLIVDVRLEAFNGLQLAILAHSSDSTMRIVVMSGWDDPVIQAEAASIGAVFLPKPFNEQQLLRAVEG